MIRIPRGEGLKVFGPMSLRVVRGAVEVLGKRLAAGEGAIVHKLRSLPLLALEDAELDTTAVGQDQLKPLEGNEPYFAWLRGAQEILDRGPDVVVVMGPVDSGKSSFTTLLINVALAKGMKPALVDADVGQADVAPPGFVSLAFPERQILWNRELKPYKMIFVGDIKPQKRVDSIIYATKSLAAAARGAGRRPIIVDTDGWVGEVPAIVYKLRLCAELMPSVVVLVGNTDPALERVSKLGAAVLKLPSPEVKKSRSRDERREYRSDRYREYFAGAPVVKLRLDKVLFPNLPLLEGERVEPKPNGALYASRVCGRYMAVLEGPGSGLASGPECPGRARLYEAGFERGLYVSVIDRKGDECPGLIERIDFEREIVYLRTPCSDRDVVAVVTSNIRLNEKFEEEFVEV